MKIYFSNIETAKTLLQEELGANAVFTEALLADGYLDPDEFLGAYWKYGFKRLPFRQANRFADGSNHFSYPAFRLEEGSLRLFFRDTFEAAAAKSGDRRTIEEDEALALRQALQSSKQKVVDQFHDSLYQTAKEWVEENLKLEMESADSEELSNNTGAQDHYTQTTYKVQNFPVSVERLMENMFSENTEVNEANNALVKDSFGEISYTGKTDSQGKNIFRVRRVIGGGLDDKEIYMTVSKEWVRDESGQITQGKVIGRLTPQADYQAADLTDPVNPYSFLELEYNITGHPGQENADLDITLKVNPDFNVGGYELYSPTIVGWRSRSDFGQLLKDLATFGVFNAMAYHADLKSKCALLSDYRADPAPADTEEQRKISEVEILTSEPELLQREIKLAFNLAPNQQLLAVDFPEVPSGMQLSLEGNGKIGINAHLDASYSIRGVLPKPTAFPEANFSALNQAYPSGPLPQYLADFQADTRLHGFLGFMNDLFTPGHALGSPHRYHITAGIQTFVAPGPFKIGDTVDAYFSTLGRGKEGITAVNVAKVPAKVVAIQENGSPVLAFEEGTRFEIKERGLVNHPEAGQCYELSSPKMDATWEASVTGQ